jgi:hypothetical protein
VFIQTLKFLLPDRVPRTQQKSWEKSYESKIPSFSVQQKKILLGKKQGFLAQLFT